MSIYQAPSHPHPKILLLQVVSDVTYLRLNLSVGQDVVPNVLSTPLVPYGETDGSGSSDSACTTLSEN